MSHHPRHHQHRESSYAGFQQRHNSQPVDVWLQIVDGGLAGVIFLAPLLMGGRHPLGQLVLMLLAVATAGAWGVYQWRSGAPRWRPTWALLLLLAGAALPLLQVAPLPTAALHWLTPHVSGFLPLWNSTAASAGLGDWPCISLAPAETRAGLALFLAYGLLFVVVVQRTADVTDVERLLRWCGLAAMGMAVFGLVQFFTNNGKFFWFYQHPFTDTAETVKGSFSNRNHFADFLALGIGPLIWWLQDMARRRQERRRVGPALSNHFERADLPLYLLGLGTAAVVLANLLSLSRGGIVAALIAAAICVTMCYRVSAVGGKVLAGLAAAGLLIGVTLGAVGYDRVANRVNDLVSGSLDKLDHARGRRDIWAATVQAIPDHLLIGTGVGSFQEVYPVYSNAGCQEGVEYTHCENGPLQNVLEMGVIGFTLVLLGIACCAWWCIGGCAAGVPSRLRLCAGAIAASLTAFLAHGMVDFVWYVPACVSFVAILAACALRIRQLGKPRAATVHARPLRPWAPVAAVAGLLLLGGWMVATCGGAAMAAPYWDQYLIALDALQAQQSAANHGEIALAGIQDLEREQEMIATLEKVVGWQPSHFRAQLALAELHVRQFENLQMSNANPMSLVNVHDAVVQSQFASRDALFAWLLRAVGEHWTHLERALHHARQALAFCPLEGRAYVYLAQLGFLEGNRAPAMPECVQQALRVRPFDGTVLYAASSAAYLAGDSAQWFEYAKQAFHAGPAYQRRLIADLINHTAPEGVSAMVDFLLREFQPDLDGLRFLHFVCVPQCSAEQLEPVCRAWVAKAEQEALNAKDPDAAAFWLDAVQAYRELGETMHVFECAEHAVKSDPNSFAAHYELASCLIDLNDCARAETQLHWCLQRSPDCAALATKLKKALQGRMEIERRTAIAPETRR